MIEWREKMEAIESEEMIDVELHLGKDLADKINKMSKKELTNSMIVHILKCRVQEETIDGLEKQTNLMQKKIDMSESYIDLCQNMIESVIRR